MNRFRVAALLVFGATLMVLPSAAHARAASSCASVASVVTVSISAMSTTIGRSGNAIQLNGVDCGAATVSNTSKVIVNGTNGQDIVTLDLTGGPFAPGLGAEATGAPEIEFEVNLSGGSSLTPDTIVVQGTGAADTYRLGGTGINLNNDDDADVTGPGGGALATMSVDVFKVFGGAGADTISAAGAVSGTTDPIDYLLKTELYGGDQNDTLTGGNSYDTISGGPGNDVEVGGNANDTFLEDASPNGNDDISGGDGPHDVVDYSARAAGVNVTLDNVANDGKPGSELDNVHADNENFALGSGDDTFLDNSGLYVGRVIYGGLGADTITGGTNSDVIDGCGPTNDAGYPQYGGELCSGDGGDTLHGGAGGDTFLAQEGNDQEFGDAGLDTFFEDGPTLHGGMPPNGADDIHGGPGEDGVIYDYRDEGAPLTVTMNDNLANDGWAGEGDNVRSDVEDLVGSRNGPNTITGTDAANSLAGGDKADTILALGGNDTVNGKDDADTLSGGAGDDYLYGGAGNDTLHGENGKDTLHGDDGNDLLDGGPGTDKENGDAGDDTFWQGSSKQSGAVNDTLDGGADTDTVSYAARTKNLSVTLDDAANDGEYGEGENDNVKSTVENIIGGSKKDMLTGSQYDNVIDGGLGTDVIDGGSAGNDTATYVNRSGNVVAKIGGTHNSGEAGEGDTVKANIENLVGGSGDDFLGGNAGPNVLTGNIGNDTLYGGGGGDWMEGDNGNDTFQAQDGVQDHCDGGPGTDGGAFDPVDVLIGIP